MHSVSESETGGSMRTRMKPVRAILLFLFCHLSAAQEGWITRNSGTSANLVDVQLMSQNVAWAVGGERHEYGLILKTTNGGSSWSKKKEISGNILFGLFFLNNQTGWAVGYGGTVLKTVDGGNTWEEKTTGISEELFAVHFSSESNGWAVGTRATIIATTNGGDTWTDQPNPYTGTRRKLRGVYFVNDTNGWVVGHDGIILKTQDGGNNWFGQYREHPDEDLRKVVFITSQTGWAFGEKGIILKTTNGGSKWNRLKSRTGEDLWGGTFINQNIGWAVGDNGVVLRTTNGGTHWLFQQNSKIALFNDVSFFDADHGIAVGGGGAVISTQSGGIRFDDGPQFVSSEMATAYEDVFFEYEALALDPNNDPVEYVFTKLPSWLSADENRVSGWTPAGAADTLLKVEASDGSHSASLTVSVTVVLNNNPPEILSAASMSVWEGEVFTYTARAVDPDGDPVSYAFEDYPYWADVTDSVLSGTVPSGYPSFSFRVIASDGDLSDDLTVQVTVMKVNAPPVIISDDTVKTAEGEWFQYTARAHDPDGDPLTYSFARFPAWLTPADSTIFGEVPEGAQDTSMVVHVSDGQDSDSLEVIIRVEAVDNTPRFLSPDSVSVLEGDEFQYAAHAEDPEGESVIYGFLDVPDWLTVQDSVLTGTAPFITETQQVDSFRVTASDGTNQSTLIVTVVILKDHSAPQIVNISDITFSNNETYAIWLDTCVVDNEYPVSQMTWAVTTESPYLIIQFDGRLTVLRSGLWTGIAPLKFTVENPSHKADSLTVTVTVTGSTSVPEESAVPKELILMPNFPNPFNPVTSISYSLPGEARVTLDILNVRGEVKETLVSGKQREGGHSIAWDAAAYAAGTYIIRLRADNEIRIRKCLLIK